MRVEYRHRRWLWGGMAFWEDSEPTEARLECTCCYACVLAEPHEFDCHHTADPNQLVWLVRPTRWREWRRFGPQPLKRENDRQTVGATPTMFRAIDFGLAACLIVATILGWMNPVGWLTLALLPLVVRWWFERRTRSEFDDRTECSVDGR
jgi:hypothetical protein